MNSLTFSRFGVVALAICTVLTLSSCNNKTDQSAGGDASSSPSAPDTASSTGTSSGTASPSSTTSSPSGNLGVAPQGTACPTGNTVKGVTSKKLGGKIYLTNKSPEYSKIKPEKCFADVEAAKKAGYGAPK